MKSLKYILLFMLFQSSLKAQQKVKIACIGNSITYGYLIPNREHNAYPAQLQTMLGDGYQVMNFGASGKTALHAGGNPYIATQQYQDALNSKANIVFIKLGTNDSRPFYRKYIESFYVDYKVLVHTFRILPTHPRVILLCPVVNFLNKPVDEAYNLDIPKYIIPVIQKVAAEESCEIIDLHPLLIDHPEMFPDKLHPDSAGAAMIAHRLYEFLIPVKKSGAVKHVQQYKSLAQKAILIDGNVPKLWKRSHRVYSFSQTNGFENTI